MPPKPALHKGDRVHLTRACAESNPRHVGVGRHGVLERWDGDAFEGMWKVRWYNEGSSDVNCISWAPESDLRLAVPG